MSIKRVSGLIIFAALVAVSPALADECGGEGPSCSPPPPPRAHPLPPPVVTYGGVSALTAGNPPAGPGESHSFADPGQRYVTGVASATASTGTITYGTDGSAVASAESIAYPRASVSASIAGGAGSRGQSLADIALLYSVTIHAVDLTHADALVPFLGTSGAIATVSGSTMNASLGGAYAVSTIVTGGGLFDDYDTIATSIYNFVGGSVPVARAEFGCDNSGLGLTILGTAGCGSHDFTLPINFVRANNYDAGSALDFIGNIKLRSSVLLFGSRGGVASAYLDPTVTLTNAFGNGYSLSLGVANGVAAAVPEPAAWSLMLVGFGSIGAALRRRSAVVVSA